MTTVLRPGRTAVALGLALLVVLRPVHPGAAPDDITLGMSAAFTGESSELGVNLYRGAQAYFSEVNAQGGIEGRRVRIRAYDDGYVPERTLSNTLALIERDHAPLLFGYVGTGTVTRVLPLLTHDQKSGAILLFPFSGAGAQRESPYNQYAVNLRASYADETAGLVDHLVGVGHRRIAVFYQADPYGRSAWDGVRKALARHGLRMAGEATYHRGAAYATDMRAQVDILRASGADAVITGGTYAACAAFIRDAVDARWPAPVASLSFVGSLRFIELLTSEGRRTGKDYTSRVINSEVVPSYDDPGVSAGREYLTLTERHRPGAPPIDGVAPAPLVPTLTGFEGFLDAKLLTEALRRSHGATDRESLWRAFRTIEQYDLGIGTPVSLGGTRAQGLDTVYYVRIAGDRFVPVTEWQAWAQ